MIRRAAAIAMTAVMTRRSAVMFLREYRGAPDSNLSIFPPAFDRALQQPFAASHFHRRKEFAVGKIRDVLVGAAHADEFLNLIVIRRQLRIRDWPIIAVAVAACSFEFVVRQPIALSAPGDRASADVPAANPIKRFLIRGGIGVIDVIDKELPPIGIAGIAF